MAIVTAKLAGRCTSGLERGQGVVVHALENPQRNQWEIFGAALCKAEPGRRSVGWTEMAGHETTCPKCLRKLCSNAKVSGGGAFPPSA